MYAGGYFFRRHSVYDDSRAESRQRGNGVGTIRQTFALEAHVKNLAVNNDRISVIIVVKFELTIILNFMNF